jgi:hypothetical protein
VIHSVSLNGLQGEFVGLDVEDEAAVTLTKSVYGRLYAAAVCAWVKQVTDAFTGVIPLLYTTPGFYGTFLKNPYPENRECLRGLPGWVAIWNDDGGEATEETGKYKRAAKEFCVIGKEGDRCIIHQYTARGIAMIKPGSRDREGYRDHLQMDRLYRSVKRKTVNEKFIYVRVER